MTGEPETKTSQLQMLPCISCPNPAPPRSLPTAFSLLIEAQNSARAAPTCAAVYIHLPTFGSSFYTAWSWIRF